MLIRKILRGDELRKSRLHDEKGNFVGWRRMALHAPLAVSSGLLRLSVGHRPLRPWISYSAASYLSHFLNSSKRVLEFGSGMSTMWYADRSAEVCSVEDCTPWYEKVSAIIKSKGISNITYQLAENEQQYVNFRAEDPVGFDLIMVDGSYRSRCAAQATALVRQCGIIYLDNSDKDSSTKGGDMRSAEDCLREFASRIGAAILEFTDFAPTQFFVQQGLLLRMPTK
jgi:hypothetical protein